MEGARGFWLRIAGVVLALVATAFATAYFKLGAVGMAMTVVVTVAGIWELMRYSERLGERAGALSPSLRRYNRRALATGVVYLLALALATWVHREWRVEGAAAWLLALLPTLAMLAMIWAVVRALTEETDEYLRANLIRQTLIGCGFLLAVASCWGTFEMFDLVPHAPAWAAFPVFALGQGLGASKWGQA